MENIRGINKDTSNIKNNNITFALNAVMESSKGDINTYSTEPGNEEIKRLSGYKIKGVIYGENNTNYLFLYKQDGNISKISEFKNGVCTDLIETKCLNFKYDITGEYKVKQGCKGILYFNDNVNPDRRIDLSNLSQYNSADCDTNGAWDCDLMELQQNSKPICIELESVNESGGRLIPGSYYFNVETLDKSQNLVSRSHISPQTIIYQDNISIEAEGNYSLQSHLELTGGIKETNKSITINIKDIDINQGFVRINVIRAISGNNQVDVVSELIQITSNEQKYTFSGFNNNFENKDLNEILLPVDQYKSSYVMEQVQNRLIRANLKEEVRDYNDYQKFASKIKTEFNTQGSVFSARDKDPRYYWDQSFMPDEIEAFGIVYIHRDYSESPVFHIPGRCLADEITTLDYNGNLITISEDLIPVSPNSGNNYLNQEAPTYKIFNTGYHQTDNTKYTKPLSCCTDNYWGEDYCGNSLEGTPVRHHRIPMPDTCTNSANISVNFSNLEYPEDVIGHYFVRARKTVDDYTVTDGGIIGNLREGYNSDLGEMVSFSGFINNQNIATQYAYLFSPEIQYNNSLPNFDYLFAYKKNTHQNFEVDCKSYDGEGSAWKETDSVIIGEYANFAGCQKTTINFTSRDSVLLKPLASKKDFGEDKLALNLSQDNNVAILRLNSEMALDTNDTYSVLFKKAGDPHNNLNSIVYEKLNDCTTYGTSIFETSKFFSGGDAFSPRFKLSNTILYQVNDGFASDLFAIFTIAVGVALTVITAGIAAPVLATAAGIATTAVIVGAAAVTAQAVAGFLENLKDGKYESVLDNPFYNECIQQGSVEGGLDFSNYIAYAGQYIDFGIIYSRMNISLRHSGTIQKFLKAENAKDVLEYTKDKVLTLNDENKFEPKGLVDPEYYLYNDDYNRFYIPQYKFPLDTFSYDFCSECLNHYPNRLIFSTVDQAEANTDSYTSFLTNDYIDLPAHRGEITGLKYINNRLLVHCKDTTYILQTNPSSINTSQTTIFISSSNFLGIPEQEMYQTDLGYGGLYNKLHTTGSKHGYVWVDSQRGEIFNYTNKIDTISRKGLMFYFKDVLPNRSLRLTYDPFYERLLITGKFKEECKNFTLSYNYKYQSWISWHSYVPNFYFNDNNNFYSEYNDRIYKHGIENNYAVFNNFKYPFVFEHTQNNQIKTNNLSSIFYVADSKEFTDDKFITSERTFNKIWVYNDTESTGEQELSYINQFNNPYQNIFHPNNPTVIKTDENYKISGIYDFSTSNNLYQTCQYPVDYFDNDLGYSDKVSINTEISNNQYMHKNLNSKYYTVRLIYIPNEKDIKQFMHFKYNNTNVSKR